MRFRIKFEKRDAIGFSSHKDVVRMFQRCLAACEIPVSYSKGFRPHMKMSFGPPLKTGWEGYEEYLDIYTDGPVNGLARVCNDFLPGGLRITDVVELVVEVPKLASDIRAARMSVCVHKVDIPEMASSSVASSGIEATLMKYQDTIARRFAQNGGANDTNGKLPEIVDVTVTDGDETICIDYTSTMLSGKIVKPDHVVAAVIGDPSTFRFPIKVVRHAQYVSRNGEYLSPVNQGVIKNKS